MFSIDNNNLNANKEYQNIETNNTLLKSQNLFMSESDNKVINQQNNFEIDFIESEIESVDQKNDESDFIDFSNDGISDLNSEEIDDSISQDFLLNDKNYDKKYDKNYDEKYDDKYDEEYDEANDEEYDDDFDESEEIDNYDDSEDGEFIIESRRSKSKVVSKKSKNQTKRTITSAFGKSRRPIIQFKKKKKSNIYGGFGSYGGMDYGDTTTEEEIVSEEEIDENDYYYTYEEAEVESNNSNDKINKFDLNKLGLEQKYYDEPFVNLKSNTIEKVVKYKFSSNSYIGKKLYQFYFDNEEFIIDNTQPKSLMFLIKWKGLSYLHCTWENEISLKSLNVTNIKKLHNFCTENQIDINEKTNPFDLMDEHSQSMFNDQNQNIDSLLQDFVQLDFIYSIYPNELSNDQQNLYELKGIYNIDEIVAEGVYLYCCWINLPQCDATWEEATFINKLFPNAIENYFKNLGKMYYQTDMRYMGHLKFYKMDTTPDYILHSNCINSHENCNQLRDYQLEGINWLTSSFCRHKSVILADEMGLGKTVQVTSFISTLFHTYNISGPFLIVVPLSTIESWKSHLKKWAPDLNVIAYIGNSSSRNIMRKYGFYENKDDENDLNLENYDLKEFNIYNMKLKFNVLVTTYEMILKDKEFIGQFDWVSLIVDEAHRLKNIESSLYMTLKSFYAHHRLLMTGTPLQNNLRELWSILYFILPEQFPKWEDFEMNFSQVDPTLGYRALQKEISPYILRRMKKDVEKSLPPKIEQILRVEMTKKQKDLYKCILTKNYTQLSKELKCNVSGFLNVMMELKKCCNHTCLITHQEFEKGSLQEILRGSGKLILLDKLLTRFKQDGSRVLIFSQMIMILDIISTYLLEKGYKFQRLDGSTNEIQRKQAMNEFNAQGSKDFCFLLSTRAGGLGINLVSADVVIIFDSDWNPQNDLQAQARAHRIGQTKTVKIYRLVTKSSVDETIVERAKKKMVLDHLVIQTMSGIGGLGTFSGQKSNSITSSMNKKDLSSIIKFGAQELFKEDDQENDDELQNMDIDKILLLAEDRDPDSNQNDQQKEDLLMSFKVANFKASDFDMDEENSDTKWDDIIPENERKRIIDEEETEKMAQLYLPPRRRNTVPLVDPYSKQVKKTKLRKNSSDFDISDDINVENVNVNKKKKKLLQFANDFVGLTIQDVKKFINSYKKFPSAWERIEVVATDALLTNKPIKQVQQLIKWLHNVLPKANIKSSRSNKLTINGVQMNSNDIYEAEQMLKPITQFVKNLVIIKEPELSLIKINLLNLSLFKELYPNFSISFNDIEFPEMLWNGLDIAWEPKHDSELLLGVYFYGFSNWKKMFEEGLLLNLKLSSISMSVISKKLKTRIQKLIEIINKNKDVLKYKNQIVHEDEKKQNVKVDVDEENKLDMENKKNIESKSLKKVVNEEIKDKSGDDKHNKKRKKSEKKSQLITKYLKVEKKVVDDEIKEIELSEKMVDVCSKVFKPLKHTISKFEGLFKESKYNDLIESSEFKELIVLIGELIDDLFNNCTLKRDFSVFKSNNILRCALWTFISRSTDTTSLELYNFYKNSSYN